MNVRWQLAQFFEMRWWQQYLRRRSPDVYLSWKRRYWRQFLQKSGVCLPHRGAAILDAGCGPAGIFIILDQHHTHAVDPLLDLYEQKLAHFRRSDYPTVQFFSSKLEDFDCPNATGYDIVCCLNALNHVDDLGAAVRKLVANTRPNGMLLVSVDVHRWSWLKAIFQRLPADVLHPHQYSLAEYRQMFDDCGACFHRSILIKRTLIFDYFLLVGTRNG